MRLLLPLLPVAIATSSLAQQPPDRAPAAAPAGQVPSGPTIGSALTKVAVYAASGPRAGTTFDAAAQLGEGPCALLFLHELTRNTAPMVRALDRFGEEYGLLGFHAFTVLLADDRTAAEQQCERASAALGMRNPITVSVDGSDGPGAYGLNRKCTLTLVLGNQGRVARAVGFTDTGQQDVPQLEAWIAELTGPPLPRDLAGMRALLAQRHPGADAALLDLTASLLLRVRADQAAAGGRQGMRERAERGERPRTVAGKRPDDPELATLLRAASERTASAADVDEVFTKIDARVGDDAGLRAQAVEMCKLMLGLGQGSEAAQARAKRYVAEHGGK